MLLNRMLVKCINWLDPADGVGRSGFGKILAVYLSSIYWRRRLAQTKKAADPHDESVR